MQITKELILRCLKELRANQSKYKVYQDYYNGQHDILKSYAMNEARSNQKVVVNLFKKFINDEIAYSLGNNISYISNKGDKELIDIIDYGFGHWAKIHDQELMKQANIYGEAYEIQYINEDSEFKAAVYTPLDVFVLESGNAEKEVVLALQVYRENAFSDNEMLDVYHGNNIDTYEVSGGYGSSDIKLVNSKQHLFPKPPVVVAMANTERKSMLDDIKTEIDSYSTIVSDYVNEISDFRTALLKITGASELSNEELKAMKQTGAIQLPKTAQVDYLIKNINDSFIQNALNTLENNIYKLSSHIDTNEKMQSNLSGTALRSRLIALENKCSLLHGMLETVIRKRLKNFFHFQRILTGKEYDFKTIKLKLTMNIPSDLTTLADAATKLRGLVSDETLLAQLPFVENPQLELAKRKAEEESDRIDLDGIKIDEHTDNTTNSDTANGDVDNNVYY